MGFRRTFALPVSLVGVVVAGVVGLVIPASTSAIVASAEEITITAEFVEYERPGTGRTIGPFELVAIFHPGSLGPAGVACTLDRVAMERNQVLLSAGRDGGPIAGSGALSLNCEYHPGCGPVSVVVEVDFAGVYDPAGAVMKGDAMVRSLDTQATSFGTTDKWGTTWACGERWTRPGVEFTTPWLFELAGGTGYMTPEPISGVVDPTQRFGYFTAPGAVLDESNEATPVGSVVAGGAVIPGVVAGGPPSDFGEGSENTGGESEVVDAESTAATESTADSGTTDEGGSNRAPLIMGLTVAVLIVVLFLLKITLLDKEETPADAVAEVTGALLTDPKGVIEQAAELVTVDADGRAAAAAAAAGPQFEPTDAPTGQAATAGSVNAVSPSGATLTVPKGTYPAGVKTEWLGRQWTPIKVGDDWWWAPSYEVKVADDGVGIPDGASGQQKPKVLNPLPYSRFELTDTVAWRERAPSGQVTQRHLDKGNYKLGEVSPTSGGNWYPVEKLVGKEWKFCEWVPESALPRN